VCFQSSGHNEIHRHQWLHTWESLKLPWNAISISFIVGLGKFLSNVYIDMTIPGVQKPHCDPWASAILFCTGCSFVLVLPIPSTVVTASPCIEATGAKQALIAKWLSVEVVISKCIKHDYWYEDGLFTLQGVRN
jgi:hypothetical protein